MATVLMVGLRGVAITGSRGVALAAGSVGRVGPALTVPNASRVSIAGLIAEGESVGATFFPVAEAAGAGVGALTIGELTTGSLVTAAAETALVSAEAATIAAAATAETAVITTAAAAETTAIATAAVETATLTSAAEASVVAAAESGTVGGVVSAGTGTALAQSSALGGIGSFLTGVAYETGTAISGIATTAGSAASGLGNAIPRLPDSTKTAFRNAGVVAATVALLVKGIGALVSGVVSTVISAAAAIAANATTSAGVAAGTAVAGGAYAAAGTQSQGNDRLNEQLQLRQNERAEFGRLLENDRNFRDQLRPWITVYNAYKDLEDVNTDAEVLLAVETEYTTWNASNWDAASRALRESRTAFQQAVALALNRTDVTLTEAKFVGDMERLLVSLGFNLDIFNSEDLQRLQTAKDAFDRVKDELRNVNAEGTTVDIRNQMIDTYAAALNNRYELVSKANEIIIQNRATQVSDVVAPILAAGAREAAAGYTGDVSEDLLNRRNYLRNYISSHVADDTGIDSNAAITASTSAESTTPSSAAPNSSTPNPTILSASNPPVTAPSSSGGTHPLFVPLLLGNVGQTVSVGRPQTNDIPMHHDLSVKPSGGSNNNYVPQQRDYITPQTVDTSAVLIPLAALATFILVR